MFWTNTKRIFKSGFLSFWRNGFVSLAAVLVMTITLIVIGLMLFLGAMLGATLTTLEEKVDVNVYFLPGVAESEVLALQDQLETLPEVATVTYVSREQALADFRARHENDQLTLQALDELGENPLGAILNIRARETSQYESIANFLEGDNALGSDNAPIIERVNFAQNKTAIDRLSRIIEASETLGLVISIILAIVSIVIIFNTMRLAIYSAREEISVMRLVGANNSYIRGPFVFSGILYGFVSAILTLIIFYPLTLWLGPITERVFVEINIFDYYITNFGQFFLILLGTGVILGAISSYLAVHRYLKI